MSSPPTTSSPPPPSTTTTTTPKTPTLPITPHHCRFCNHLLLATTITLSTLPRRAPPALDAALILPLPAPPSTTTTTTTTTTIPAENQSTGGVKQQHYTILLSTTIPDRRPTLIRREDGFEKRVMLRCGRCRVVMGYFLEGVHFGGAAAAAAAAAPATGVDAEGGREGEGGRGGERERTVVYVLPGALVETGQMGDEEVVRVLDREWKGWMGGEV